MNYEQKLTDQKNLHKLKNTDCMFFKFQYINSFFIFHYIPKFKQVSVLYSGYTKPNLGFKWRVSWQRGSRVISLVLKTRKMCWQYRQYDNLSGLRSTKVIPEVRAWEISMNNRPAADTSTVSIPYSFGPTLTFYLCTTNKLNTINVRWLILIKMFETSTSELYFAYKWLRTWQMRTTDLACVVSNPWGLNKTHRLLN